MKVSAKIALISMTVTTTFGTMMAAPAVKLLLHSSSNRDVFMAIAAALGLTAVLYVPFIRNRMNTMVRLKDGIES